MDQLVQQLCDTVAPDGGYPYEQCNVYVEPLSEGEQPDKDVQSVLLEHKSLQALFRELVYLRHREVHLETHNLALRKQIDRLQYENGRLRAKGMDMDTWRLRLLTELEQEKIRLTAHRKPVGVTGSPNSPPVSTSAVATRIETDNQHPQSALGLTVAPPAIHVPRSLPVQPLPQDLERDVMVRVLYFVAPPEDLLDPTLALGYRSPWCFSIRTLKNLCLVRRSWHEAASARLYSHIILRRPGQIIALLRTIREAPERFGNCLRSLTLTCEVPDCMLRVIRDSLAEIIELSPNLNSLSLRGAFPTSTILGSAYLSSLLVSYAGDGSHANLALPSRITNIGVYNDAYPNQFKPGFVSLIDTELPVRSIVSFSTYSGSQYGGRDSYLVPFLCLETLTLWSRHSDAYFHLPHWWNLPSLKSLRFRPEITFKKDTAATLANFFKAHGAKLKVVDFGGSTDWPINVVNFEVLLRVLEMCPNLEHLVLRVASPEQVKALRKSPLFARPIRHVDLVVKGSLRPAPSVTKSLRHHDGSKWQHVRYIDIHLLRWVPEIPYIFPLQHNVPSDRVHIQDYYGFQIKDSPTELALFHSPLYGEDAADKDGSDDDDDPDYCPSGSDSSDYGGSDLTDIDSDELQANPVITSYGEVGVVQMTEDEALTVCFSRLERVDAHLS